MPKDFGGSPEPQGITAADQSRAWGVRGNAISLEEFTARYSLAPEEAKRLFSRFGPSAIELELLMQAKVRSNPTARHN